jgi:hypothetical protein
MRSLRSLLLLAFLAAPVAAAPSSRLVVLVVIDQFPHAYLERWGARFGSGGFRRFLDGGAVYAQAWHPHFVTETGPGHAVLLTGAASARSGIVGNDWLDRATGKMVYCVGDAASAAVGAEAAGASAARLLVPTVGDELLRWRPRAKVVTASMKDRASILMAGQRPTGAWCFSPKTGGFFTWQCYRADLPAWVGAWNAASPAASWCGKSWELLRPPGEYDGAHGDDAPYETWKLLGPKFPHAIPAAADDCRTAIRATPFANDLLLDFARAAVVGEGLGADDVPDLLAISLSANDYVGHYYGPDSWEVQDITLRTDQALAAFFGWLDQKVGAGRFHLVLTSDHGVGPSVEASRLRGLEAARVDPAAFLEAAKKALTERFGDPGRSWLEAGGESRKLPGWSGPWLYLSREALRAVKVSEGEAEDVVVEAVRRVPGVAAAWPRRLLATGGDASDPRSVAAARSFHPERSGDVTVLLRPYHVYGNLVATHGLPYAYDAHVALAFAGPGVPARRVVRRVALTALAATVAELLGVEPPAGAEEGPLVEVTGG